jgi:hypothetical protein
VQYNRRPGVVGSGLPGHSGSVGDCAEALQLG